MTIRFRILLPLFFITQAAAILEEVAWVRALHRLIGSTSDATAAILAGILGGMALGSWLGERALVRAGKPSPSWALTIWAYTAFAAGAASLLFTVVLALMEGADWIPRGVGILFLLLLFLPSIPMGAGFPFAVASLGEEPRPSRVGLLYGMGALGGSAGAFLTPLLFIPALGERRAIILACIFQMSAGALLGYLLKRWPALKNGIAREGKGSGSRPPRVPPAGMARPGDGIRLALVFLSGLTVIYWEVVWTRVLILVVGSTVHAFSVVAGGVILGIGIGSILFTGQGGKRGSWLLPLAILGLLSLAYFFVPRLPHAYLLGIRTFGLSALTLEVGGPGVVVLLFCAPLGMVFPWALAQAPQRAGALQASNGVGAALGAMLGGPILAGLAGIESAFLLGLFFVGALMVCGTAGDPRAGRRFRSLACFLAVLAPLSLFLLAKTAFGWDLSRLLAGVYQWPADALLNRDLDDPGREVLLIAEGREAIVSVERSANTIFVKGNGKVEGSVPVDLSAPSMADLPTQLLLGILPGLLREGRPAAVIGLGSGSTLGAARRAGLKPIDLLEIEPEFARAITAPETRRYFEPFLAGVLESPDVYTRFGDARALLSGSLADRRWEVLVSQPSEPWIPAAAALFTREFFGRSGRRLNEGGLFFQWIQLYKLPLPALELLVRTFRCEFERVFLLRPPLTGGLIMIGARQPLELGILPGAAARLEGTCPGILSAMGMGESLDTLSVFLLGPEGVDEWIDRSPGAPLNTDDRSELSLLLSTSLHATGDLTSANLRAIQKLGGGDPISRYLPRELCTPEFLRRLAARNLHLGDFWEARALVQGDRSPQADSIREEADREIAELSRLERAGKGGNLREGAQK